METHGHYFTALLKSAAQQELGSIEQLGYWPGWSACLTYFPFSAQLKSLAGSAVRLQSTLRLRLGSSFVERVTSSAKAANLVRCLKRTIKKEESEALMRKIRKKMVRVKPVDSKELYKTKNILFFLFLFRALPFPPFKVFIN